MIPRSRFAFGAVLAGALSACQAGTASQAPAPDPAGPSSSAPIASSLASAKDPGHAMGDSTAYGGDLRWTGDGRTEVAFNLTARAHVVLLDVVPNGRIVPVFPDLITIPALIDVGGHTAFVRSVASTRMVAGASSGSGASDPRADYTYERCMERARQRAQPKPPPKAPTKDANGKTIDSGEPARTATIDDGQLSNVNCRAPAIPAATVTGPQRVITNNDNRYVIFFASEIPVSAQQLTKLEVNEGDIQSIVFSVAKKLYGKAPWSGYYLHW